MKLLKLKRAFTLVELIVVITILAVLGTVAFVSYDGQVDASKNTARITDISNLGTSLKNHKLKSGGYPIPGDAFNIMNNGTGNIIAKQGYMNDKVYSTEIATKPLDPEYKIPYIYSVTSNRGYYQLRSTISPEDDSQTEKAYLYGDYQTVAKTILPTLILATSTGAGNNVEIASGTTAGNLNRLKFIVSSGTKNLPYNSEDIIPVKTATTFEEIFRETGIEYPQFPGYSSCLEIYEAGRSIGSGSYQILDIAGAVTNTGCSMVFGPQPYNTTTLYANLDQFTWSGYTTTVTGPRVGYVAGTDGGIGCDTPDIVVFSGALTPMRIAACNMGTTTACTSDVGGSKSCTNTGTLSYSGSYGNTYQRGRNDGFPYNNGAAATTTGALYTATSHATGGINLSRTAWANKFIIGTATYSYNWLSNTGTSSDPTWGQGPCRSGYIVPKDWLEFCKRALGQTTCTYTAQNLVYLQTYLKFSFTGYRDPGNGMLWQLGTIAYYYGDTPNGGSINEFLLRPGGFQANNAAFRSHGFPVRCMKN